MGAMGAMGTMNATGAMILKAAVGALLWLAMFLMTDSLCWFQATIGMPCPGCGSTRAAQELLQGHFAEAFRWHPLIPLTLALFPAIAFRFARRHAEGSPKSKQKTGAAGIGSDGDCSDGDCSDGVGACVSAGSGRANPPRKRAAASVWEKRALAALVVLYCTVYAVRMATMFPHTQPMVPLDNALWRQAVRLLRSLFTKLG